MSATYWWQCKDNFFCLIAIENSNAITVYDSHQESAKVSHIANYKNMQSADFDLDGGIIRSSLSQIL